MKCADPQKPKVTGNVTDQNISHTELGQAPCQHVAEWGDGIAVSVLILNWNGKRFLAPCLESVIKDACIHVEVVLVDNGSNDDSIEHVESLFPRSRILAFTQNLGFGRAYNAAVRQVSSRFVVFLNNDTVTDRGWLSPLIDELIRDPRVAITTSKVLFLGTRVLNSAGGQLKLWQGAWELGFGRNESFLSGQHVVHPFFGSGAAMAMSREVFQSLEGFDDRLWLYGEDVDLSWRARLAGYTILYVPQSVIYHHYSGTSGVFSPVKFRLVTSHHIAVMVKCLATPNLLHSLPAYTLFALLKGCGLAIVERDGAYVNSVVQALRDAWLMRGDIRQRRRETQGRRLAPDRQVLRSEGFGLFESPWGLLRLLWQGRRLKQRFTPAARGQLTPLDRTHNR